MVLLLDRSSSLALPAIINSGLSWPLLHNPTFETLIAQSPSHEGVRIIGGMNSPPDEFIAEFVRTHTGLYIVDSPTADISISREEIQVRDLHFELPRDRGYESCVKVGCELPTFGAMHRRLKALVEAGHFDG